MGSSGAKSGYDKATEPYAVGEINCRNFRLQFEPNVILVDDCGFEIQANAVLFEDYGNCAAAARTALDDRNRKFPTRQEAGRLAVHRNQVGFSQGPQSSARL